MARGCVAIRINNRGFAAGKHEFLVRGGVNRLLRGAPAIALPDDHLPLGNDAGELAASPGWRWRRPGAALPFAPVAGGAGPRYASRVFDVSSPCCDVAVTPPSRRALDWSSQYVSDGAWITHTVELAFDAAAAGLAGGPAPAVDAFPAGLLIGIPNPLPIGLEALCGNTAVTLPVA